LAAWSKYSVSTSVKRSARKLARIFFVVVSIRLIAAARTDVGEWPQVDGQEPVSVSDKSEVDQQKARPLNPPREPRSQGSELSLVVGLGVLPTARYVYDTRVTPAGAHELRYSGSQRVPGVAVFVGSAFTLPGRLRRITVGGAINGGGLDSTGRPVIPSGATPPFSKEALSSAIEDRYSGRLAWRAAFSSFVEHEIGFFKENRVRAGYQYWSQFGSYAGSFAASGSGDRADYNVHLNMRSHLLRISVNEYLDLQEESEPSHRARRRGGIIRQWGFMVGTHQTIMVFAAMGPFWQIVPHSVRSR
jgi:hypothetical protein